MGLLSRFEDRLEQMVSGVFAKAFRSEVKPVESFSGSIGKISAAVYTEVVFRRACTSIAVPLATSASTSAIAMKIRVAPDATGSA